MFKKIRKYLFGSSRVLATGLVVVPIVNDIGLILAGQMASLMSSLGWYVIKKSIQVCILLIGGLLS